MSEDKMRWEAGEGAENSYMEQPAAGAPLGYGARPPPRSAAGAPPRRGPPPPRPAAGAPPGYGARPPQRPAAGAPQGYGAPRPSNPATSAPQGYGAPRPSNLAAGAPQGYGPAPPGYAQPQQHYAQPQAQEAPGGYKAYAQQQQMPAPSVVYGVPPPPTVSHSYQAQQPHLVGAPPMMQQQGQGMVMAPVLGQWTTGLCDFGEDPVNAVVTCFLPCITFGQIAEVVDEGTTSCLLAGSVWVAVLFCFAAPCLVSCLWRSKLRAKYNLPNDEIEDFCLHLWCEPCALCQEYRELNNRGLNPSLGWQYHRQQLYAQSMQPAMGAPQQVYMQR